MIAFVSHHYALPEKVEEVRRRQHETGMKMRTYPGFISRTNLEAVDDPTHMVSVAFWETEEALDGWDYGPDRGQGGQQGETVWAKPVFRVRFKVMEEFKQD
ncbi:MAG: antibiotic biosynthesis monooxygenase [Chloroflexota bacterium]